MKGFQVMDGDVTSPKGFQASGIHIGIKKYKKDMTLIVSDVLAEGAAVFTTNKVCAAPVVISKENIKDGKIQAIIINSGNANACTGKKGLEDAREMVKVTAEVLNVPKENVMVASTGIIGIPLPMDVVLKGIPKAVEALSVNGGMDAAYGILTTDTCVKKIAVEVEIDGKKVTIGGIAKGSGMIHPNMATMLAFVTTDGKVEGTFLQKLLKQVVDKTYNMISVDGDSSTNDMVCVMANGLAENNPINDDHSQKDRFIEAFQYVHEYLAKAIVRDGEGATKFLEVEVCNSATKEDAKLAVKAILNSNLVKTAFFGEDGNWGRILCSVGYSGASFNPYQVDVFITSDGGHLQIVKEGQGTDFAEKEMEFILKYKEIKIMVDLHVGTEKAKGWGCDLSYDYVKINGEYRT